MRKIPTLILAAGLLTTSAAFAGNLTFDNGVTSWHSTQCVKPVSSGSVSGANSETSGDNMNGLMGDHNSYAVAAQNYMDCVSNEASNDQDLVNKAIVADAQKEIAATQAEVDASLHPPK